MNVEFTEYSSMVSFTMKKVIVGSGYLVLSLFGTCLNLSTLSVLPECEQTLGRPLLIFFSVQLFIGIGTLLSVAIPVPYMTATNRPYFMNPLIVGAPGVLICVTFLTSFLIQFCICIYRSVRIVCTKMTQSMFPDIVVQILIGIAFILAISKSFDITKKTTARRFSLESLSWEQTDHEYVAILSVIVYSSIVGVMFYALSIFDLLYQHIYDEEKHEDEDSDDAPKTRLFYQILHLVCDVAFCTLIILPRVSDPQSNSNLAIMHSFINIFGTAIWPTISLIIYSSNVKRELVVRTVLMCNTCSSSSNNHASPAIRSRIV
ncbi:hypothetical protein Q1695_002761 [Nippostrongylus brasiliensis]|nr:hypothetical protein Q1695_002761 [Nippostrongylus brasiliensis]